MRVLLIITAVYAVKPKRSPEEIAQMERQQRCAHQETRWLFVRGLHHSGTTLMRTLLAAHKDVGEVKTPGPGGEGQHARTSFPSYRSVRRYVTTRIDVVHLLARR